MYAVIQTGGKQYRVAEGDTIRVEKLAGDVGSNVEFTDILMVGGEKVEVGKPHVGGAKVTAEIVAQDLAKKIIVFKMKRRKGLSEPSRSPAAIHRAPHQERERLTERHGT